MSVVSPGHKRVSGPLCCVLPLCHVSQCRVSRYRVPLFLGLSPRVGHATDHLGPTPAFRPAECCISTCISASLASGTGRHHIRREGCGDAAVQHVWSGMSAAQQYGCAERSCTHDRCRVGGGRGCAWAAAVGQAWRKRRGCQPVSLPPQPVSLPRPACLVATVKREIKCLLYESHQKGKMMSMILKTSGSQIDSPVAEGNRKEGGGRKMRDLHKDT